MSKNTTFKRIFTLLRLVTDIILIPIIFVFAYSLKFKVGWVLQNIFSIEFGKIYNHAQIEPYFEVIGIIIILWIIAFYYARLYQPIIGIMTEVDEFVLIVKGVSMATAELMVLSFLYRDFPESRYVLLYSFVFGIGFIFFGRLLVRYIEKQLLKRGIGVIPTLIVGGDDLGQDIAERILTNWSFQLKYIGTIDDYFPEKLHFHLRKTFKHLGYVKDLKALIEAYQPLIIFLSKKDISDRDKQELILLCNKKEIELRIISDLASLVPGTIHSFSFDGLPCEVYRNTKQTNPWLVLKRLCDILLSGMALLVLSPLFLLIALYIKWISPSGPVFFLQERVTLHNRIFKMIKFRTMVPDAETNTGPVMVNEGKETRYIKGGNVMRRTSIDELPQLINIFLGDMSIVGPRPERPFFIENFNKDIPYFSLRHHMRGGLTGWAQVNGRSVLTRRPEQKIKYDLYYISNWSLLFDLKIILKTFFVVLYREEAY